MSGAQRSKRANGRLITILLASMALHAALFLLSRLLPPREVPKKKERITVSVREVEKPPEPPTAPPPPKPLGPPTPPAKKPQVAKKTPPQLAQPTPPAAKPPPVAEPTPEPPKNEPPLVTNKVAPTAPPGPVAAPKGPDLGKVRLFDANALGMAIQRSNPNLPKADRLQANGDDPNSAGAEAARVSSRLQEQLQDAISTANVTAGFASACDDGIDNNFDGEIDCADPGCRALPLCDYTGVYENAEVATIPDGDGQVVRKFQVPQEGRVRKLTLMVDVMHASPGDLALTLVAPDGQRTVLRSPDRGDFTWKKAYYVRPFIGRIASGTWTLEVEDRHEGVRGILRSCALFLTS